MKFIEVSDRANGDRPVSIVLDRIEMFYPMTSYERGDSCVLEEVNVGTVILLEGGRKVESSMLYVEFKERVMG